MTYKRYEKYKYSGVEWLGEIPEHWKLNKLKNLCTIGTGNKDTINKEENGKYPFYVRSPIIERISTYSFDGEAVLTAGDGAGVGKVFHYVNGKFDFHQRVYKMSDFKGVDGKFIYYYIKENFIKETEVNNAKSTVDSIRLPMIQQFPVILPTYEEQRIIVGFLDKKTIEIDSLVQEKEKLVELLKEQRQAIITEVVTKGLDKDVDMKDSGVDWIGKIPKTWQSKKVKYIFGIRKIIAGIDGLNVLSVTQNGLKIKDISKNDGQLSMDYSKYQIVEKNDFVMNHMDLLTGWVDCSIYNGVTSPDYRVFRLKNSNEHSKRYYTYIMQACYKNKIFYGLGQGVSNLGRWRLQTDKFENFIIPVPAIEEQNQIAEFLDKKINDIEKLINDVKIGINNLKDYKQSLISEVVTGKIDIRE